MTRYNSLNLQLCNSQLSKLRWGIKNGTKVNLSQNEICDSNDETNFLRTFLLLLLLLLFLTNT